MNLRGQFLGMAYALHGGDISDEVQQGPMDFVFRDAMVGPRPHLSARVLTTICLMAWNKYGRNDVDPRKAAGEWSTCMDKAK